MTLPETWQLWKTVPPNHCLSSVFGKRQWITIEIYNDVYWRKHNIPFKDILNLIVHKARKSTRELDKVASQYKRQGNVQKILHGYYFATVAIDTYCHIDKPAILDYGCGINPYKALLGDSRPDWLVDTCDMRGREWYLDEFAWLNDHIECDDIGAEFALDAFRRKYDVIILSRPSFLTECDVYKMQLYLQRLSYLLNNEGIFVFVHPGMTGDKQKQKILFDNALNFITIQEYNDLCSSIDNNPPFVLVTKHFRDTQIINNSNTKENDV